MLTRDRKSGNKEAKREKLEIYTDFELVCRSQTKCSRPKEPL